MAGLCFLTNVLCFCLGRSLQTVVVNANHDFIIEEFVVFNNIGHTSTENAKAGSPNWRETAQPIASI